MLGSAANRRVTETDFMSDNNSEIILDLARELFPNLTKGLEQVLIEFGTQLLLQTRNIPVAW